MIKVIVLLIVSSLGRLLSELEKSIKHFNIFRIRVFGVGELSGGYGE